MRPPTGRSTKGNTVVVETPTTRAITHTILGAISAMGVVNIEIRVPAPKPKKIKVERLSAVNINWAHSRNPQGFSTCNQLI